MRLTPEGPKREPLLQALEAPSHVGLGGYTLLLCPARALVLVGRMRELMKLDIITDTEGRPNKGRSQRVAAPPHPEPLHSLM